jgi:hypothetical protein
MLYEEKIISLKGLSAAGRSVLKIEHKVVLWGDVMMMTVSKVEEDTTKMPERIKFIRSSTDH